MRLRTGDAGAFGRVRDHFDWTLFISIAALAVVGVINLYSATSVARGTHSEDYIQQIYWLVGGGILATVAAAIDYRHYERLGYGLYAGGVVLLLLVFILGREIRGSSRWIYIGSYSFQPSEFMKLFLVIALAKYLHDDPKSEGRTLKELVVPTVIAAIPTALVLLQPDLGTALILILVFVSICTLTRIQTRSLVWLGVGTGIVAPVFWSYGLRGYQNERINAWLNPNENILGYNWDPRQARIAVGNGGWFGQGFMKGSQNQFLFLHEQHSDFPFPVFAEEWGFVGSMALVALYGFVVLWCLRVASSAKDRFGAVLAVGVASIVFWHAVFNLGMATGLLPVVGVTLPLFSYGGSSVMTMLIGVGLVMNVSVRRFYAF
ncbi:MAG TPA: rod shape-determining protein RodA [Polyangiaceae bacterium]|nr:rod shape-determining protein RodA [Polyangiaceae bacterium]